jgi:RimJ/RimL family protein N-acetyltransferase
MEGDSLIPPRTSRYSLLVTTSAWGHVGERRTARLLLRPWTHEYDDEWMRILGDPDVVRFISDGVPFTGDEALEDSARGTQLWAEFGFGPWAATEVATGRWVGRIGLNLLDDWPGPDRWEVGWELDPEFWGRGLATEGGREAVTFGFSVVALRRIISVTRADHSASRRVMEKCGLLFQEEVLYRNVECVWYAIDHDDWQRRTS